MMQQIDLTFLKSYQDWETVIKVNINLSLEISADYQNRQ